MSEPAPNQQKRFQFPEQVTAAELAEFEQILPEEMTAHHLRWLETGEGTPWPESSG